MTNVQEHISKMRHLDIRRVDYKNDLKAIVKCIIMWIEYSGLTPHEIKQVKVYVKVPFFAEIPFDSSYSITKQPLVCSIVAADKSYYIPYIEIKPANIKTTHFKFDISNL